MTEKQYAPTKTEKKATQAVKTLKQKVVSAPVKKQKKSNTFSGYENTQGAQDLQAGEVKTGETEQKEKINEKKTEEVKEKKTDTKGAYPKGTRQEPANAGEKKIPAEETKEKKSKETKDEKKTEVKKSEVKKVKRIDAVVNSFALPISTKISCAICKFIKGKKIEKAIEDLNKVAEGKKAVPMKGEIPHRKGKGMMSGRFPGKASKYFITLLKALKGNSNVNELENPIISEAIANLASRPHGTKRTRKKRTHVRIKVKEKKLISKDKKKGKKK